MKFGIIRERKSPPDRRVVFTPLKIIEAIKKFPDAEFVIEPSEIRAFTDKSYSELGIEVSENMDQCEVLLGVKEVPIDSLIENKSYFFFSHTIKKQPYNRDLLRAILNKNITLYDHETLKNGKGSRLVAFGRYAGIVGAYNGFRAYGLKSRKYILPKAETLESQEDLINHLKNIQLGNIKILLTGRGRVGKGAKEMLDGMGLRQVGVADYLKKTFEEPVYCNIDISEYNKRMDGIRGSYADFFANPEEYRSDFFRFAEVTDLYIAGHFYGEGAPYLFTREDVKNPNFKITTVADISCDIDGPVATTIRPSTIAEPIYGYDPISESEVDFKNENAIAVMAVDNLPCELPKDASEGFGEMFLEYVIPAFFNNDKDGILDRAKITENGKLTPRFAYLQAYVDGLE
ncbi:NAD(P)-dependent oxidoreductase [Aegicerativicinus sediminis]|uniref:NAD(P)-dependent oxidoreductase n=1 Tax=Aegicerativicinus sediminis TaxID=2893202 RepID=UPI001E3D854B|nr:NAD(P)-dependent oxidoreductase [Aegicerativicinus sediminis]